MTTKGLWFGSAALISAALFLQGCALQTEIGSAPQTGEALLKGSVHGGQQPVGGASLQLYAVGTLGDGSAPTPLLHPAVSTGTDGSFTLTTYTCPTSSTLVYLVATGGNPGLGGGTNNTALMEMAALGACGSLSGSTSIQMNEVTTVAAVAALAPYMTAPANVGSGSSDLSALTSAFSLAAEYADYTTGISPGAGYSDTASQYSVGIPVATIHTLANILASCINTAGPTSSSCSQLSSYTDNSPDTLSAIVAIMKNPSAYNTTSLLGLAGTSPPFQPQLGTAPATFAVSPQPPTYGSPLVFPFPSTVSPGQMMWMVQKVYNSVSAPCLEQSPNYLRLNSNVYTTNGTAQCGLISGYLPSNTPYGSIYTEWISNTNVFGGYVNVVPAPTAPEAFKPSAVFWEGTAGVGSYDIAVTLQNNIAGTVTPGTPKFSGTDPTDFSVATNGCTASMGYTATCTMQLYFSPPDAAFRYATLTVPVTDGSGNKYYATVQLGGSGMY